MPSANETTVRRHFEALWNKGTVIEELFTDDYVGHPASGPTFGVATLQQNATAGRRSFPDLRGAIDQVVDGGDDLVVRFTLRGTHKGDYQGLAPTGKTAEVSCISMFRLEDGKIAESWTLQDTAGLMRQLGMLPAPASA